MNNVQDLFIVRDLFPVFDYTLNDDSKILLKEMLLQPLSSITEIIYRQDILKALGQHQDLLFNHQYRKVDYLEVQRFLLHFAQDELKQIDYLTYLFQAKKNNALYGYYSQLIYFLKELEDVLKGNLDLSSLPKAYQSEIRFLLNYLNDFKLTLLKSKISKQKFGFKSMQKLNELVLEKRKNGDTLLFFDKFNKFEAYISICKAIQKLNLSFVEVGGYRLLLKDVYHPLVKEAVKNDVEIRENVVLLTGANMSGKSTLLKTIGLCVYLAHLGLPIPVRSGCVPFYDHLFIHINHSDDLKNGYSHFINEIMNLKNVVLEADRGKRCFAIFDELFKGTNHEDALVISTKTLLGLQRMKDSLFFVSTHLTELKENIVNEPIQALYIDCTIVEGIPVFSYKLKEGWSDLKIGQLLFTKLGLEATLVRY